MLDNRRQEVLANNYFLNKRKDGRKKIEFDHDSMIVFAIAFVSSILLIIWLYMISPYSKTFKVTVKGNNYLNDSYIIEKANLSKYFLLTNSRKKEKELVKDPFIQDAKIRMLNGNIVEISVEEIKQIGYIFEDGESKLLLINDERIPITKDLLYLIGKVPLIEGYSKEELVIIENSFKDVDYRTINEISEIHKYPISYDEEQMEIIMRDGNYCFLSSDALHLLKNYYSITSAVDSSKGYVCVYFDNFTNSAYISSCPWQVVDEDLETDNEIVDNENLSE